ncbi:MAG: cytochrome c' [Idiomarinaceae bacterium HL-53]|nr:MAG: cytochrome c' [Idiomarinaceae bacterium HL-53]CUS48659.1 Cytochrome c556 [Idiomarinaceae bacterium HL-53]
MQKLKLAVATSTLILSSFAATLYANPFTEENEAVEYRQQALALIRDNFGIMAAMVRNEMPYDAAMFEARAEALSHLSYIPWDGFTGVGANVTTNSDALPAIWEDWDDFAEKSQALIDASQNLAEAAQSGDMSEIRPAFMATARTCQQCHEGYRAD